MYVKVAKFWDEYFSRDREGHAVWDHSQKYSVQAMFIKIKKQIIFTHNIYKF